MLEDAIFQIVLTIGFCVAFVICVDDRKKYTEQIPKFFAKTDFVTRLIVNGVACPGEILCN